MTKALHCKACNSIHTPPLDGSPITCDCGKVQAWWHDPTNGIIFVKADDHNLASVISIHNGYLNEADSLIPRTYFDSATQQTLPYHEAQLDSFWRTIHEQAGPTPRAPEAVRIWDTSRRACPWAIVEPGTQSDVQWAT